MLTEIVKTAPPSLVNIEHKPIKNSVP